MGFTKRIMEDREADYQQGVELCIKAGALEQCEYHEGIYYRGDEPVEEAYKLANSLITQGKIEPGKDGRTGVTDSIKRAYEDNIGFDECAQCAKAFAD